MMKAGQWLAAVLLAGCISACGGGSDNTSSRYSSSVSSDTSSSASSASSVSSDINSSSSVSSTSSEISSASSAVTQVSIRGAVTYDFVPLQNPGGLNYALTEARPVRHALVELLDSADKVLASGQTTEKGDYLLQAPANTQVRVRVLAQSRQSAAQRWDIRVEDNTAENALYAMSGRLHDSGNHDGTRDLHAPSGWDGNGYGESRVAAPFAILDTAYMALAQIRKVESAFVLPTSYFRWSPRNRPAEGLLGDGDIGTSFYDSGANALYILGQENVDTDEYDRHVIAHEWMHYLEDERIGRMDSIGGNHGSYDKLDLRVAWSEGLANAFSGIVLDDPLYLDSFDSGQSVVGGGNLTDTRGMPQGWYSEASVQALIYTLAQEEGFDTLYSVLTAPAFRTADSLHSIFTFIETFTDLHPVPAANFRSRLLQQGVTGSDEFATDESNDGGTAHALPVYQPLEVGASPIRICSSQQNGSYNKLGVTRLLQFEVAASGHYQVRAQKTKEQAQETDPDMHLYYQGERLKSLESSDVDREEGRLYLEQGRRYVLEVYDYYHAAGFGVPLPTSCFDLTLVSAN